MSVAPAEQQVLQMFLCAGSPPGVRPDGMNIETERGSRRDG